MTIFELSELLGNIGEFVGSIAILVTLGYLAIQVKHSRNLLEENKRIALGQVSQTNAGFRLGVQQLWTQPHLVDVRVQVEQGEAQYNEEHVRNFDQLNLADKMQWRSMQSQFAILMDDGLFQSTLGLIEDEDREILERSVIFSMPYWDHFGSFVPSRLRHWYEQHKNG